MGIAKEQKLGRKSIVCFNEYEIQGISPQRVQNMTECDKKVKMYFVSTMWFTKPEPNFEVANCMHISGYVLIYCRLPVVTRVTILNANTSI